MKAVMNRRQILGALAIAPAAVPALDAQMKSAQVAALASRSTSATSTPTFSTCAFHW